MTSLSPTMRHLLVTLSDSIEPLSGRRIAGLTGLSPTTANKELAALLDLGVVTAVRRGRAVYWQTTSAAEKLLLDEGQRAERSVLVLTALPLEYVAVRDRLSRGEELRAPNGARYLKSSVSGRAVRWTVYVFEVGMGNATAASLIGYAVEHFNADLVMFVGVAAGLKPDDQEHGDVVIAERVYNAHSGKDSKGSAGEPVFQSRPKGRDTAYPLVQLARYITRAEERGAAEKRRKPRITLGSIASVEAVVANESGQLFQHIRNRLNDCIAIDMESFGAYEAAHANSIPVVAVRGISDFVADKVSESDVKWQPIASRNAADVAADMLIFADPDDVPPRKLSPTAAPDSDATARRILPPHAQVWANRLRAASPTRADAAEAELASDGVLPLASWVSKTLNRPPAWLRADLTGEGWALVGALAEIVEASTAPRAYARAAEMARESGDLALAGVHQLRAALSIRMADDAASVSAIRDALRAADLSGCPELNPLSEFHLATTQEVEESVLAAAAPALASLGYDPSLVGLGAADSVTEEYFPSPHTDGGDHEGPAVAIIPVPDDVRVLLTAIVLVTISATWLLADDGDSAQRAAEEALALLPESPVAQLRRAQAVLTRLHARSPTVALEDTSVLLQYVEDTALAVRHARQQWGASAGDALALAGRARVEGGDAIGALRLLRSAPHGQATAEEFKSDEVRLFAALAALEAGDEKLAVEFAATLPDGLEAQLVRGAAFTRSPGMRREARLSYMRALELAQGNPRALERALLGLARLGPSMDGAIEDGPGSYLQRLRDHDPQAADLVLGNAALTAGNYDRALRLARRHRTSLQAVELETYALMESGNAADAVERLDSFGRNGGDYSLRVRAMMLARQADLYETVDKIADSVIGSQGGELRRVAREAKAEAAGRRQLWEEADTQARKLLEEIDRSDLQRAAAREATYRWMRAEALFHGRKFVIALKVLFEPVPVTPTSREHVRLVLAIAQALVSESPRDLPQAAFGWILSVSASWVKDEQIGAEASNLLLMAPVIRSDSQLMDARALLENYFTVHGNGPALKRIELSPNPEDPGNVDPAPLIEYVKSQFEPQAEVLGKLSTKVWLGQLPVALLAEVTHRSYAESLIKQALGCYPICEEPPIHVDARLEAARSALQAGRVVVDTSALVIGGNVGIPRSHLTGLFRQVIFPASLRDDVYAARAALARRSDMAIGWDPAAGQPTLTRYDANTVRKWAEDADALQRDLAHLSIQPDVGAVERGTWSTAAVLIAQKTGVPLWVDDIALRTLAESEAVPVFGTLDLIAAAAENGQIEPPTPEELNRALVAARAVDLPFHGPWWVCAQSEDWDPRGYTALSISRPAAWSDQAVAFTQYRSLIRKLIDQPSEDDIVARVAGWAAAAAHGSAWATPSGARPKVVGVLLAWTALNTEPMLAPESILAQTRSAGLPPRDDKPGHAGKMLDALLTVATGIQASAFPNGDAIHHVIVTLADTIRTITDGISAAAIISRALDTLSEKHRTRAMMEFLASPAAAGPAAR